MSNLPPPFNDGLFSKTQGVVSSPAWRQWFGKLQTSVNTIITNIAVTGTGLVHIVNGVIQSAASLITNGDVSASAGITESKLALNYPTHSNANDPTTDQKAALAGTNGTPSAINPYVTNTDLRNANVRQATNKVTSVLASPYVVLMTDEILIINQLTVEIQVPDATTFGNRSIDVMVIGGSGYTITTTCLGSTIGIINSNGNFRISSDGVSTWSVFPYEHAANHKPGGYDRLFPDDIGAVVANGVITAGTNTKITYDAKGLVTAGAAATLASADFVNQGTTTTVLHGNAAGNPAFGAVVEADITLANNTTNNVSITKHGFCPIAPNSLTQFLRGDGGWGTPAGTGMSAPTGTGYVHITGGAEDAAAATGYLFTGMQILTSASGTYTPTAGTTAILVEVQGAGGGGGGCATNAASYASAGGGGGGGGYAKLWIASPAASYVYSVAAGANGGAAGNNPGTTANPSTFGSGPLITANGGTGGLGGASQNNSTSSNGSDGGTAIGGNLNIPGGSGTGAIYLGAGNAPVQGLGGATLLGTPGKPWAYAAGSSGQGYGSGGNGASAISSQSQQAGGKGAAGLIIVWEYK
jgi:hypothetical protein